MPYGRYGGTRRPRKPMTPRKKSGGAKNVGPTTNAPVNSALSTYKKAPPAMAGTRRNVSNNRNAIVTLARQVKSLQMNSLGLFQKRCEKMNIVPATDGFNRTYPLCFCMNQFNDNSNLHAQMYKVDPTSGAGTFLKRFEPQGAGTIFGTGPGPYLKYNPHWGSKDDTPSTEVYQPLGTKVRLQFEFHNVQPYR